MATIDSTSMIATPFVTLGSLIWSLNTARPVQADGYQRQTRAVEHPQDGRHRDLAAVHI